MRRWLAARAIAHRTLRWRAAPSTGATQAQARAARLALLTGWCRRAGVLHLLLGHQREDQAETALQRLVRGSGIEGLAAMAPVRLALEPDGRGVRLLRPLLSVSRDALADTLAHLNQPWLDDPTNRDTGHARPRLAAALARLEPEGLSAARLAAFAARAAEDRAALDGLCTDLLAQCASPAPAGFVTLDRAALHRAPPALALRALGRAVTAVSRAPRTRRGRSGWRGSPSGYAAATPSVDTRRLPRDSARRRRVLVCREPAAASETLTLEPGESVLWDRRFVVALARSAGPGRFTVRRLGTDGLAQARAEARAAGAPLATARIPPPARPALPRCSTLTGRSPLPTCNTGERAAERGRGRSVRRIVRAGAPVGSGASATLRVLPLQDEES